MIHPHVTILADRNMTRHRILTQAAAASRPAGEAARPAEADQPTVTLWQHVATLTAWLDDASPPAPREHLIALRVMKLAEETGEAVAAYIGMTGHNPRKGICATPDDLTTELCDVVITAMVALATCTRDPGRAAGALQRHLLTRSTRLLDRIGAEPGPGQWACRRCGAAWYGTPPEDALCPPGCQAAA